MLTNPRAVQAVDLADGFGAAAVPFSLRLLGIAHATFEISPELDDALAVGLFAAPHIFPATVRFSSDLQHAVTGQRGTCGVAIQLLGGRVADGDGDDGAHEIALHAADDGIASLLETSYAGVRTSLVSEGRFARYELVPEGVPPRAGIVPDLRDPFYLGDDLHARLRAGEARFGLVAHLHAGERGAVRWPPRAAEPVHLATLVLPRQDLDAPADAPLAAAHDGWLA